MTNTRALLFVVHSMTALQLTKFGILVIIFRPSQVMHHKIVSRVAKRDLSSNKSKAAAVTFYIRFASPKKRLVMLGMHA